MVSVCGEFRRIHSEKAVRVKAAALHEDDVIPHDFDARLGESQQFFKLVS